MQEAVVFVHGIWMKGLEMSLLRRRIGAMGYACYQFSYPSLFAPPVKNAAKLNHYLRDKVDADVVHFVAHSLGGVVLSHLFESFPHQKPGRIVLLGSPIRGSAVAKRLHSSMLTRGFIGHSTKRGLLGDLPPLKCHQDIGVIAGNRGLGVGTFVMMGGLEKPNDGTVSVKETDAEVIKEHLQVPYSHFSMLWAAPVAQVVGHFLKYGRFH